MGQRRGWGGIPPFVRWFDVGGCHKVVVSVLLGVPKTRNGGVIRWVVGPRYSLDESLSFWTFNLYEKITAPV